jgi:diguanylate cyclase (GGDEF)-like protein
MGNSLKKSPKFRQALNNGNSDALTAELQQQFHQYFVTAHVLRLERLIVLSADYQPVASASAGNTTLGGSGPACSSLHERARQRQGAQRLQIISILCNNDGRPYHSVLMPLGGLVPRGYLEVITSPVPSLKPIEQELGMPLSVRLPDGDTLYRSNEWPDNGDNGLIARYQLQTSTGNDVALLIEAYDDTRQMYTELARTRNTLLLSSVLVITVVILVALVLLRRTLIHPLEVLNRKLQQLHGDNKSLGEPIQASSNIIEVNQLVDDFNRMSLELHNLYARLERMAYTDPMTRLPNRGLFNNYIDYLLGEYHASGRRFALMLIDLDEFKRVNDEHGHEAGDMLLCEAAARMNSVLRTPSIVGSQSFSLAQIANHDLLVRLGGDEFAVVIPDFDTAEQLEDIAAKLVEATCQPVRLYNHPLTIHLSIGIAIYPDDGSGRTSLLRRADSAMYHAKNHGRDYCFYHHGMIDSRTAGQPEPPPTRD